MGYGIFNQILQQSFGIQISVTIFKTFTIASSVLYIQINYRIHTESCSTHLVN